MIPGHASVPLPRARFPFVSCKMLVQSSTIYILVILFVSLALLGVIGHSIAHLWRLNYVYLPLVNPLLTRNAGTFTFIALIKAIVNSVTFSTFWNASTTSQTFELISNDINIFRYCKFRAYDQLLCQRASVHDHRESNMVSFCCRDNEINWTTNSNRTNLVLFTFATVFIFAVTTIVSAIAHDGAWLTFAVITCVFIW